MSQVPMLSICIPSYNRPEELYRLLKSVDITDSSKVEIVICEDCAPKREVVRAKVEEFKAESKYAVNYIENEVNQGYDRNLRECIKHAKGTWVMFMGDDDSFVPGTMDAYLEFLERNTELGYVLRSYRALHRDGSIEEFKYFAQTCFFEPGYTAYVTLFRKTVFISGVCFKRELALENMTDRFDGTLLYQLYIMAEICMKHSSAYYGTPITQMDDEGIPYFGSSETERELYTPGTATIDNSVNFMKKFFVVTEFMDEKYGCQSTEYVKKDISKYAYPVLSIQRKRGRKAFAEYHRRLKQLGLACTKYYYVYYVGLYLFGEGVCDKGIRIIKRILGKTPQL